MKKEMFLWLANKISDNQLKLISGLFWTLTYLMIIYTGFKDSMYGMPIVALCFNLSWEFYYSILNPHNPIQLYVNYIWLLFDVIIFIQCILFWKNDLPPYLPVSMTIPILIFVLLVSLILCHLIGKEFNDTKEGKYSAFGDNFMMSILFVTMLLGRGNLAGQSFYIGLFKLIGTSAAAVLVYKRYPKSQLLNFLYIGILFFDMMYCVFFCLIAFKLSVNPFLKI